MKSAQPVYKHEGRSSIYSKQLLIRMRLRGEVNIFIAPIKRKWINTTL